jgi:hypothetical protein
LRVSLIKEGRKNWNGWRIKKWTDTLITFLLTRKDLTCMPNEILSDHNGNALDILQRLFWWVQRALSWFMKKELKVA